MWQVGIEVRKDITAATLRKKARAEKEGRVAARMLGIANVLDGMDRTTAAQAREWIGKRCAIGFIAITKRGLAACAISPKGDLHGR